ncbi:hypothetical protein DFH27DRAFT_602956 [Peziza echinospora]|nr:hypothetical protein DFH27DRAFT_602956 [Peziza echinospora]
MRTLYGFGSNLHHHHDPSPAAAPLIHAPAPLFADLHDARVVYAGLSDVLYSITPKSSAQEMLILRGITAYTINTSSSSPENTTTTTTSQWELHLPHPTSPSPSPSPSTSFKIHHAIGSSTGEFLGLVLHDEQAPPNQALLLHHNPHTHPHLTWTPITPFLGGDQHQKKAIITDLSLSGTGEAAFITYTPSESQYTLHLTTPSFPIASPLPLPLTLTPTTSYPLPPHSTPLSLTSTICSHALLLLENQNHNPNPVVYTLGDPRHPGLLLHPEPEPEPEIEDGDGDGKWKGNNQQEPSLLALAPPSLDGIPSLTHLTSSQCGAGWYIAAHTSPEKGGGGGIYIFGGRRGLGRESDHLNLKKLAGGEGEEEEEEEDVYLVTCPQAQGRCEGGGGGGWNEEREEEEDEPHTLALGTHHLLLLTTRGKVYSCGRGAEGQLGRGGSVSSKTWTAINLPRGRALGVWAGGWGSWVLVDHGDEGTGDEDHE